MIVSSGSILNLVTAGLNFLRSVIDLFRSILREDKER